jgi:NADH dehydrogenase [ubiquinone] 1 alpha subcomplex assembly factor 7
VTPLGRLIADRIAATGPVTVADYMADCLLHPVHGYYTTREPFGAGGDFTTAPEISQMFGELVGLCLAQAWRDQGAPSRITLAEIGPGRGTLQAQLLPGAIWHDRADLLPDDRPLFLIANEVLDALPVRQFVRAGDGWSERVVGLVDGRLSFGLTAPAPLALLAAREGLPPGTLVEHCPGLPALVGAVAAGIADRGGAALFIDYGHWLSQGDTLQALSRHGRADPLAAPGEADLTTHVDFAAVAAAALAAGAAVTGMTRQGDLLNRLGIGPRTAALARSLSGPALDSHLAAARRLTHRGEMGDLFKVIGLHRPGDAPPPGLDRPTDRKGA